MDGTLPLGEPARSHSLLPFLLSRRRWIAAQKVAAMILAIAGGVISLASDLHAQSSWPEPALLLPMPTDGPVRSEVIQLCQHLPAPDQGSYYAPATMGPPTAYDTATHSAGMPNAPAPVLMQEPMYYEENAENVHYCEWGCDERWIDNFSVFTGLEGSKQPQDFGVNAHFGGRVATNLGIALHRDLGIGFQIGTSINATASAVQVLELIGAGTGRVQSFTTVGLFQRTDGGWIWGVGYDFLYQEYTDVATLGQARIRLGYELTENSEIGARAMIATQDAQNVDFGGVDVTLEAIDQAHLYWRKFWASRGFTECWIGISEGHSEANIVTGDRPELDNQFVFGSSFHQPLNDYLALYGEANLMMPSDTGTVDAFLGFECYPGGGSWSSQRNRYNPALGVANNTNFSVNLFRQ